MITISQILVNPAASSCKILMISDGYQRTFLRAFSFRFHDFLPKEVTGLTINDCILPKTSAFLYLTSPEVTRAPIISVATLFGTSA